MHVSSFTTATDPLTFHFTAITEKNRTERAEMAKSPPCWMMNKIIYGLESAPFHNGNHHKLNLKILSESTIFFQTKANLAPPMEKTPHAETFIKYLKNHPAHLTHLCWLKKKFRPSTSTFFFIISESNNSEEEWSVLVGRKSPVVVRCVWDEEEGTSGWRCEGRRARLIYAFSCGWCWRWVVRVKVARVLM